MKTRLLIATLLTSGLLFAQTASAHDEAIGAVFGGITGAAIGHAIDGRDAAVAGAIIGALVGGAIANDNDHREYRESRRVGYTPAYQAYPVYQPRPVIVEHYEYRRGPDWQRDWNDHDRRGDHDGDRDGHHRW
jgi:hypothetical protein